MDRDQLLTIEQAAAYLACSPAAVRKWIQLKILPSLKLRRLRRIRLSDLEAFIKRGASPAA